MSHQAPAGTGKRSYHILTIKQINNMRINKSLLPVIPVLFTACTGTGNDNTSRNQKPNVLFILADDVGYGDLQCYGNPFIETPVLNSLAADGIMFTHYYTPSPLCAPARAALLTGRFNHRTGAIDVSSNRGIDRIALSEKTFGDYFRHAGYATALIGKWHNGLYNPDYLPHNRGFDLFYGFPNGNQNYWNWNLMRNGVNETNDGRYMTDVFNEEAIQFIRAHKDQPFALFLSHHACHSPILGGVYQAPDDLVEKYKPRVRGMYDDIVAVIYAQIEAMDRGLGSVFDELQSLGLWENTIIVFTSDNGALMSGRPGESMFRYNAGLSGNKSEVLEQGVRVPAIVAWPGKMKGGRVETVPVNGIDWLPTLYSLTGEAPPQGAKPMDGLNIMPLLLGEEMPELFERPLTFQKTRYTPVAHSSGAIRDGRWKLRWPGERTTMMKEGARDNYFVHKGANEPHWEMPLDPEIPSHENVKTEAPKLFDILADPAERNDLSSLYPELAQTLKEKYEAWFFEVYTEWEQSFREVIEHDREYWKDREAPDPVTLFSDYWEWRFAPEGTDPDTANPLEVFTGYWSYE